MEELKAALESVSHNVGISIEKCAELVKEVDKDKDGEIDFEEFLSAFTDQRAMTAAGTGSASSSPLKLGPPKAHKNEKKSSSDMDEMKKGFDGMSILASRGGQKPHEQKDGKRTKK